MPTELATISFPNPGTLATGFTQALLHHSIPQLLTLSAAGTKIKATYNAKSALFLITATGPTPQEARAGAIQTVNIFSTYTDQQVLEVVQTGQFGVAEMENGRVVRLVEKPSEPKSNLAVAGVYVFSPEVHAVIDTLRPSARGEFEITDAVQGLVDRGRVVQGLVVDGWWKDTGRPADLLDANRLLLEDLEPRVEGLVSGSSLTGRVVVERGATVLDSTIVGPALIATGAVVESAYVGPFTSIEAGAQLRRAEVEFSILDQRAVVENVSLRLQQCILGVGARVTSRAGPPVHSPSRPHRIVRDPPPA